MKKNDDIPLQRSLRIGRATVGLIGLDVALAKVLNSPDITEDEAVDLLMKAVSKENYIPDTATDQYREALRREYRKHHSGDSEKFGDLSIKILGKACVICNKLNTMTFDILQEMGVAADIELIHDPDEIWRHGVLTTPALIINDEIRSSGKLPRRSEVEEWLRDAVGS
jgi:hypothetical protein